MDIGDHRVTGTQGDSKAAVRVAISGMAPRKLFQGDALARRLGLTPSIRLTHCISHAVSGDD
jgi:hypothetical protein